MYARGLARDVDEQFDPSVSINSRYLLSPYVYARGLARDVKRIIPSVHDARGLARDITFWSMSTLIKTLKNAQKLVIKNFLQKSRGSRDDEAIKSTETRMHYM